jgi:hypothetical protein
MRRTVFLCAVTALSAITWKNLSEEQRSNVLSAVKSGRRKLANFIAPEEDLGDLTDRVSPEFLETLISQEIEEAEALEDNSEA